MEVPRKRRRRLVLAGLLVLVLAGVALAAALGGFGQLKYEYRVAAIGQVLELGPWELAVHSAWVEPDDSDPAWTVVTVEATCRNTTHEGVTDPNYLSSSVAIKDPNGGQNAQRLLLYIGSWDTPLYPTDAFNPADTVVQCRLTGTFTEGFSGAELVQMIAMPIVQSDGLWETIQGTHWVFDTAHPWLLDVPLRAAPAE